MTGAGTFAIETPTGRLEAEARSVNSRFLKSTVRSVGPLPGITQLVEEELRRQLRRGHVTVHVHYRPLSGLAADLVIDEAAFEAAAGRLADLAQRHGLGTVSTHDVLAVPGVLRERQAPPASADLSEAVGQVIRGVVGALQTAREREGALLTHEVQTLLEHIEKATTGIEKRAGEVPRAYRAQLQERLADLLEGSGVEPDPTQLARACALLAEKSDVREEIVRLLAHVEHARGLLGEGGPVGRRLDFLVQELHREANTAASKTIDLELSQTVLELRAAIESLREQVQNLE